MILHHEVVLHDLIVETQLHEWTCFGIIKILLLYTKVFHKMAFLDRYNSL